ncbi:MAG: hypothetical protein HDR17_10545 [Lachnospiraceae bacterium]|nr:hypothetical protein [Lachnospiraceae bacterium]MBD5476396.1 hypothetical protein [Lachnospiraceae bacterium]
MDFEKMELDELKDYAKSIGLTIGNIGKEKLIAKIKEKEASKNTETPERSEQEVTPGAADDTSSKKEADTEKSEISTQNTSNDLLSSIASAIDDLEDATGGEIEEIVDLPNNYVVRVKSITFGGLTYKSRSTNAVLRWNQIGAVQDMTIAELNEMNNYKTDFLRKPLVILMDEKAIKKFRLTPVYENVAKINNLAEVFESDMTTIEKVIDDAIRVNMRDVLISKVRQMYKTDRLTNVKILKLLQDKLQFDILSDDI